MWVSHISSPPTQRSKVQPSRLTILASSCLKMRRCSSTCGFPFFPCGESGAPLTPRIHGLASMGWPSHNRSPKTGRLAPATRPALSDPPHFHGQAPLLLPPLHSVGHSLVREQGNARRNAAATDSRCSEHTPPTPPSTGLLWPPLLQQLQRPLPAAAPRHSCVPPPPAPLRRPQQARRRRLQKWPRGCPLCRAGAALPGPPPSGSPWECVSGGSRRVNNCGL